MLVFIFFSVVLAVDGLVSMGVLFCMKLRYAEHHKEAALVCAVSLLSFHFNRGTSTDGFRPFQARAGDIGINCSYFLFILLIYTFFFFVVTDFQGRRIVGIFMMFVYIVYLLFCVLCEYEIIHAYGTDHSDLPNL